MEFAEEAIKVSSRAVNCDTKGEYRAAVYYYKEALKLLELAYKELPNHPDAVNWCKKMHEYADRSHFLQYQSSFFLMIVLFPYGLFSHYVSLFVFLVDSEIIKRNKDINESKNIIQLKQCHFLLKQALDADESGLNELALELYTRAVDLAITTVRNEWPIFYVVISINYCILN